ncbi:hypothetical protein ACOME3_008657 [Neoechinorhynchus agilis]
MSQKSTSEDSASDDTRDTRQGTWTSGEIQETATDFVGYSGSNSGSMSERQFTELKSLNQSPVSAEFTETVSTHTMRQGDTANAEGFYNDQTSGAFYEHVATSSGAEPMAASIIRPRSAVPSPLSGNYYENKQKSTSVHQMTVTMGTDTNSGPRFPAVSEMGMQGGASQMHHHQSSKLDISRYPVNKDPCPTVIVKHPDQPVQYDQNITIRCLKPPTPPPAPPVIIKEVRPPAPPAAPPIYVRQQPPRPRTPPPLIIRERPPAPPVMPPPKVIHKIIAPPPPPPRKVIIEKLPPIPPKPRKVIIEKWLPYPQVKRRIIYQRAPDLPPAPIEKNTIIRWTEPQVQIHKRIQHLGVVTADPSQYVSVHGSQLADSHYVQAAMSHYGVQGACVPPAGHAHAGADIYYEDQQEIMRLMQGGMTLAEAESTFAQQYSHQGHNVGLLPLQGMAGGMDGFAHEQIGGTNENFTQQNFYSDSAFSSSQFSAGHLQASENFVPIVPQETFHDYAASYFSDPMAYASVYSEPCPPMLQPPFMIHPDNICPEVVTKTMCQYIDQPGHDPMICVYCKGIAQ